MSGPYRGPASQYHPNPRNYDRSEWLAWVLDGTFKPKPPAWWISAQAKEGRIGASAYAIWHKNYPPERKYVIWDQAPDEDWREHGYLV